VNDLSLIPPERIERLIIIFRGQKVMLSYNLAELHDVEAKALVQVVKRNIARFPKTSYFSLLKMSLTS